MTALALSISVNLVLLATLGFCVWRQRKFAKPYDPKVILYACRRDRCGWVKDIGYANGLTTRSSDAKRMRLSEAKGPANAMVKAGYYVTVVRLVHPEHWRGACRDGRSNERKANNV